jgi:hypothetical protein
LTLRHHCNTEVRSSTCVANALLLADRGPAPPALANRSGTRTGRGTDAGAGERASMGVEAENRAKRGHDDASQDARGARSRGSPGDRDGCRGGRRGGARAAVYAGSVVLGVEAGIDGGDLGVRRRASPRSGPRARRAARGRSGCRSTAS